MTPELIPYIVGGAACLVALTSVALRILEFADELRDARTPKRPRRAALPEPGPTWDTYPNMPAPCNCDQETYR